MYLVALLATVSWSVFRREGRWLALYLMVLFVCDRAAIMFVSRSDNATSLYFLAWAYMFVAIAVSVTHKAVLMGVTLVLTSLAFIAGGLGVLTWDATGTTQEIMGYIAMLSIVLKRGGGSHRHVGMDNRPHRSGRRVVGAVAAARRQDRR